MGYYTYYQLEIANNEDFSIKECLAADKKLAKITSLEDEKNCNGNRPFVWISSESMKWYDHEQDMIELSLAFPKMKFILYGDGEDRDDNWIEYYQDGKFHRSVGRIVYEPEPTWW